MVNLSSFFWILSEEKGKDKSDCKLQPKLNPIHRNIHGSNHMDRRNAVMRFSTTRL